MQINRSRDFARVFVKLLGSDESNFVAVLQSVMVGKMAVCGI